MKTKTLVRIGLLPLLAFLIFACKKEAQINTASDLLISESATQKVTQQGPAMDWSVGIQVTKNACDEQIFTLTGSVPGNANNENIGLIEFTIRDGSNVVVGGPYKDIRSLIVTTQLAPGTYSLAATISNVQKVKGTSSATITVEPCADCPYKSLKELTCADFTKPIDIGGRSYNTDELCQLLEYNRGNDGKGALIRLAQAIMVAKWNGFDSQNPAVAAADALMERYDALNPGHQASVPDQYGAPEKGHVQDLVKCVE